MILKKYCHDKMAHAAWLIGYCVCMAILPVKATAQSSITTDMRRQVLADLIILRDALSQSARAGDRQTIKAITFEIAPVTTGPIHAFAYSDGTISIGERFIASLHVYVDALATEITFDRPNLAVAYMDYTYGQSLYRDPQIPTVSEFARLNHGELEKYTSASEFHEMRARLTVAALSFVVAHEIAHIASAGFYDKNASAGEVQAVEAAADNYAIRLMVDADFHPYVGIAVGNTYLSTFESPFPESEGLLHTPSLERTLRAFDYAIDYTQQVGANVPMGIDQLRDGIIRLKTAREITADELYADFKRRLNSDPPQYMHPRLLFQMGRMYFEGVTTTKDQKKGFNCFVASIGNPDARHDPAFIWVGHCYEHGLGVEKNLQEALLAYQAADAAGLKEGRLRYKILKNEIE